MLAHSFLMDGTFKLQKVHSYSALNCSVVLPPRNSIQSQKHSQDFEPLIMYSHVFAIFYRFWDITVIVLCFFCSSLDCIMGVYCGIFSRLGCVTSSPEWQRGGMNLKISETTRWESHNFCPTYIKTTSERRKFCEDFCDVSLKAVEA